MKNSFKKTSAIVLFLTTLSFALIGCGTGADTGSMGSQSSQTVFSVK